VKCLVPKIVGSAGVQKRYLIEGKKNEEDFQFHNRITPALYWHAGAAA
jgi:hypothetical protein